MMNFKERYEQIVKDLAKDHRRKAHEERAKRRAPFLNELANKYPECRIRTTGCTLSIRGRALKSEEAKEELVDFALSGFRKFFMEVRANGTEVYRNDNFQL